MDPLSLTQIAQFAGARIEGAPEGAVVLNEVFTDSRSIPAGALFIALRGDRFDGHDYLGQIAEQGAAAAMVAEDYRGNVPRGLPLLRVGDTLLGLQQLAAGYRASLPMRVIGITGSNGKTSTKDFLASALSPAFRVLKTAGNFNNHIGLPLTLLRAEHSHEIAVLEMGLSHPGDISRLSAIAKPDAAILTHIGMAHIEFMRTREAIALEKGMLAEAVPPSGAVILCSHDDFTDSIAGRSRAPVIRAGIGAGDVRAEDVAFALAGSRCTVIAGDEKAVLRLPVPGRHMVSNALLAIAAARHFGVPLADACAALGDTPITGGRLQLRQIGGLIVLDDTYNANPDSMTAALRTLAGSPVAGRRIAVLGRMAELGELAGESHALVGAEAARCGIDFLIVVGDETASAERAARAAGLRNTRLVVDAEAAVECLRGFYKPGDVLLVKGSRSAHMERVIELLENAG